MNWTIIQLFVLIELSFSLAPNELIIFILSQPDEYHYQLAEELRADIYNQSSIIAKNNLVNVHLLHETFHHPGYWTFLAILPSLTSSNIIKPTTKWIILCEDRSSIDLKTLIEGLSAQDYTQVTYYGHPLRDQEATIIHHFAFFENPQWFSYPLLRSGVIFTIPLIERLGKRVQEERPTMDFFIDASHELSLFIWQNIKIENPAGTSSISIKNTSKDSQMPSNKSSNTGGPVNSNTLSESKLGINFVKTDVSNGEVPSHLKDSEQKNGDIINNSTFSQDNRENHKQLSTKESEGAVSWRKLQMTTMPYLCSSQGSECAIYPSEDILPCDPIRPEAIYFAIKTCHKFHKDRLRIIETTWGQYAVHKKYFSDITDDNIPTISTGVPNTETGHCAKTLSILKLALEDIEETNRRHRIKKKPIIEWIFLSDDDTILSISAVCSILGCFNPEDDIYLGERYGYRLHSKDGFNYITGGGGIVFSLPTVRKIVTSCTCPTISSPDDMIIGVCLQRLGVKAIHSSRFHQARSLDYSATLLKIEEPISFHKFWQINPSKVYKKWFKKADDALFTKRGGRLKSKSKTNHNSNDNVNNCDINSSHSSTKIVRKNLQNGNNLIGHKKSSEIDHQQQQHIEL